MKEDIFVQIASYKDPELFPTILDLIGNSDEPNNLRIVVCWQHGEEQTVDDILDAELEVIDTKTFRHADHEEGIKEYEVLVLEKDGAVVEFIDVDYRKSKGACWARNMIQQTYDGEKFTLHLDSHHRFVKGWDTLLKKMYEQCKVKSEKPIITSYLPAYDPKNDPDNRGQIPCYTEFDRFTPEGVVFFMPRYLDEWKDIDTPPRARFYSGHFAFTDGKFSIEVQHDPNYYFHGEEISISVRAFTHGYDIYSPHRLVAWHEYTRSGRVKMWDEHTPENKKKGLVDSDWTERNLSSLRRNRILFGMEKDPNVEIDFGKYGFGNVRTLREYEEYAGISFEYRGAQQETLDRKMPPVNFKYATEEEWKNSFIGSHDVIICVHKSEFPKCFEDGGKLIDDIDFCAVGVHDKDGKELFRRDLTKSQFEEHMRSPHGFIHYNIAFTHKGKPHSYVLWPHSETLGWLDRVEVVIKDK